MSKPTLYLMLGYPGAGKTTVSKIIHELTGATHLWADKIRNERFAHPTHSHQENLDLYGYLNELTAELLATGQDVIFDTAFNFKKDREHLVDIARQHGAETKLIWVQTPKKVAQERATHPGHIHYHNDLKVSCSFRAAHKSLVHQFRYQLRAVRTFYLHTSLWRTTTFTLIWSTLLMLYPFPFIDRYLWRWRQLRSKTSSRHLG